MKKIKGVQWILSCLIVSFFSCSDDYSSEIYRIDGISLQIAKYDGNRDAAVVLSFDDGTYEQYQHACPALEARGLTGTFFINGLKVRDVSRPEANAPSMWDLKDMVERGFEVSNHTFHHAKLTEIPLDSARREIQMNDSAIAVWTGVRPLTFAFPYNARNKELIKIAEEGRAGVRTYETGFGQTYRTTTYKEMVEWVKKAVKDNELAIGMYHGIEMGYDYWKNPQEWYDFLDYLVANEETVWVTTFRDASKYIKERDNTKLSLERIDEGVLVTAHTNLDTTIFDYPLTLIVKKDGNEQLVKIEPNGTVLLK